MNATAMKTQPTVFVIDDDDSVRRGISNLLRSAGHNTRVFASGRGFLDHNCDEPGCVILDLQMPGTSGLELQEALACRDYHPPIIFLTGHGNVSSSVKALKNGATDFLEKPVDEQELLAAVDDALKKDGENRRQLNQVADARARLSNLTVREFEVLRHVIAGSLNKQIAYTLDISEKTVKVHRARVMEKMAVHSVAELVRLTEKTDVRPFDSHTTIVQ